MFPALCDARLLDQLVIATATGASGPVAELENVRPPMNS
jgi:hypothetical protein